MPTSTDPKTPGAVTFETKADTYVARASYSANGYHVIEMPRWDHVEQFIRDLRSYSNDEFVFRGQSNAIYPLESSLTRILKRKAEKDREELRREHMRTALFALRGRVAFHNELAMCLDELSRTIDLSITTAHGKPERNVTQTRLEVEFWSFCQHYGLATPLLDWTYSPGVALFFAVEQPPKDARQMAAVFALNAKQVKLRNPEIKAPLDFVTPIRLPNQRIAAQHGLFTLCERDIPIEEWVDENFGPPASDRDRVPRKPKKEDLPVLFKLVFPLSDSGRNRCMATLRDSNVTHSTVYPDIQGATDHANRLLLEKIDPALHRLPKTVIDPAPADADADIGLGNKSIFLRVERDQASTQNPKPIIHISEAYYATPGDSVGLEEWKTEPAVESKDIEWRYRAGCAYVLKNGDERLFLKTPDRRHFSTGSLGDIRASFSEEHKNLAALHAQTVDPDQPLRLARVIASLELILGADDSQTFWPRDKKFPVLIHQHIAGHFALDVALKRSGVSLTDERWLLLARTLTDMMRRVHNRSVLHAALASRHVLVKDLEPESIRQAYLVGFGSCALLGEAGSLSASYSRPKSPWLAPEVHETEDLLGPLSFSTDIYSLGVLLLCAATKLPAEELELEKYRHTFLLKRHVTNLLKRKGGPLGDRHDIAKIIDTCLRHSPDERYSCMEELLDAVDAALHAHNHHITVQEYKASESRLCASTEDSHFRELHPFFQMLLKRNVERLTEDFLKKALNDHYEVYGSRNLLIDYLCNFMNLVGDGGVYRTVTLPGYWTDKNLGSDGRFLAKNKDLLKRGVLIERLFLVSGEFHQLPYAEQEVLLAHYRAWSELAEEQKERFKIHVARKSSAHLMSFEKGGQAVAIIDPHRVARTVGTSTPSNGKRDRTISLRFVSTGRRFQHGGEYFIDRSIQKLRFRVVPESQVAGETEQMSYSGHMIDAKPLDVFVQQREHSELIALLLQGTRP